MLKSLNRDSNPFGNKSKEIRIFQASRNSAPVCFLVTVSPIYIVVMCVRHIHLQGSVQTTVLQCRVRPAFL
ncbi:hypothetical protein Pint_16572 [Pistacia integerrima]|uniref:Uncharacterized protein n=1 Tax=Pistacia integerrima TaxID=434235 RepID=A0ACC0ZB66_9ROSI|nr:hypothetical protein Pint_16572 [Pistacia integerrima]